MTESGNQVHPESLDMFAECPRPVLRMVTPGNAVGHSPDLTDLSSHDSQIPIVPIVQKLTDHQGLASPTRSGECTDTSFQWVRRKPDDGESECNRTFSRCSSHSVTGGKM